MTTHVGVLPIDVLDALSHKLNENPSALSDTWSTRFLRLPHPRTGIISLFLPYEMSKPHPGSERTAILEVQAVTPPNARSWFMGGWEVVADGKLLVMTPVDPAFLLIPILQAAHPVDGTSGSFRPADDIFEEAAAKLSRPQQISSDKDDKDATMVIHEKDVIYLASLDCIGAAMKGICDVKEITPEIVVYRFSPTKLLEYLRRKVSRLSNTEVFESSRTLIRGLARDGLMEDGKEDLLKSGRIRAACDLVSQYIPSDIRTALHASYDFTKLNEYLKSVQDESAAALALANTNATKKSKDNKGKDDKKRKNTSKSSQGVEKLKKTSTTGMAKLSTFFKKSVA